MERYILPAEVIGLHFFPWRRNHMRDCASHDGDAAKSKNGKLRVSKLFVTCFIAKEHQAGPADLQIFANPFVNRSHAGPLIGAPKPCKGERAKAPRKGGFLTGLRDVK